MLPPDWVFVWISARTRTMARDRVREDTCSLYTTGCPFVLREACFCRMCGSSGPLYLQLPTSLRFVLTLSVLMNIADWLAPLSSFPSFSTSSSAVPAGRSVISPFAITSSYVLSTVYIRKVVLPVLFDGQAVLV